MKPVAAIITVLAFTFSANARELYCTLIYANDGQVEKTSGSVKLEDNQESPMLELTLDGKADAQAFYGTNRVMSGFVQGNDGEYSGRSDGSFLDIVGEKGDVGYDLTCSLR